MFTDNPPLRKDPAVEEKTVKQLVPKLSTVLEEVDQSCAQVSPSNPSFPKTWHHSGFRSLVQQSFPCTEAATSRNQEIPLPTKYVAKQKSCYTQRKKHCKKVKK